jgi:hypothetical protein
LLGLRLIPAKIEDYDFKNYYRLYWVKKDDLFFESDENQQVKIKRETFSSKDSGFEQYDEIEEPIKILINNGKIVKQSSDSTGNYLSNIRWIAIKELWLL